MGVKEYLEEEVRTTLPLLQEAVAKVALGGLAAAVVKDIKHQEQVVLAEVVFGDLQAVQVQCLVVEAALDY
jgi:hypothetical protein